MFVEHQQNPHLTSQAQGPEGMSKCPVPGNYESDDIDNAPIAQKAKLGFKLLLFERLNENLKQKHF